MTTTMPAAALPEEENLWSRILSEVQSRSASSLPQGSILVLGDNESGKTSLIARLRHNDDPKKGSGMEYHYLEVNPDYRDGTYAYQLGSALPDVGPGESTRLGVWILDGDPVYAPLIKFAIGSEMLDRSLILLCASITEPWSLLESLQRWARILQDHMDTNTALEPNHMREARERQVRFWQEYLEPLDSSSHSDMGVKVPSMEMEHVLLPVGDTTLTHNMGIPVVVVITKCDGMGTLEKEYDFKDDHFDFIQQHVRKFCLNYGAALVYTSVKDRRNCDILYKYLLHRVYGFPFTQPALVVEKDAIFIPAGWDNEKKISILHENMTTMNADDYYSDHIKKPVLRRPVPKDAEIQTEDEQAFLVRQQAAFASSAPVESRPQTQAESPLPTRATRQTTVPSATTTTPSPRKPAQDAPKYSPGQGGQSHEGTLAQFFNNLLKTKSTGGSPGANGPATMSNSQSFDGKTDAATELNRMLTQSNRSQTVVDGNSEKQTK